MSLLQHPEEEVVLCSPMEGVITYKGTPVVGAKVERIVKWQDDIGDKDVTVTDSKGRFSLPIRKGIAKVAKISTFVIGQEINVYVKGVEYPIWGMGKTQKGLHDETNGIPPINFRCELVNELVPVEAGENSLVTLCKWDSIKVKIKE